MVSLVSREGRQLQRYNTSGSRLIVGCIPYRLNKKDGSLQGNIIEVLEVLVISSQKGGEIMFPKGGWELDESITEAASREAFEEAGVRGNVEDRLGNWRYKSKSSDTMHDAAMFPLYVTQELHHWPEKTFRTRKWVNVAEAMMECRHLWMKEALAVLVAHLSSSKLQDKSKAQAAMEHSARSCCALISCSHSTHAHAV